MLGVDFISKSNGYNGLDVIVDTFNKVVVIYDENYIHVINYSGDVVFIEEDGCITCDSSIVFDSITANMDTHSIEEHIIQTLWEELKHHYQNQWC